VKVIVEEAGGRFTDIAEVERIDGGNALVSNGLLHDQAREVLSGDNA
jgi:histidinol-phosphatase